jgi:hypothetical protein
MTSQITIRSPLIWPSVARLAATGAIFLFHYLGQLKYQQYRLDFFAIMAFCFLSGYLININKKARREWSIKRYFGIMIPYWLVIIPVMVANEIVHYKTLSPVEYGVTFLGGNMFLDNPLYVIAWYVTFILILYAYAYIESFFHSYQIAICMLIGAMLFFFWLGNGYHFLVFLVGLRLSYWWRAEYDRGGYGLRRKVSLWLFVVQRYCYLFLLIHGAVLLFLVKMTKVSEAALFLVALSLSAVLAVALYTIGKPLHIFVANKTLKLTDKMLARFT